MLVLPHDCACRFVSCALLSLDDVMFMQAVCAWFYVGQPELEIMLNCPGSVAAALLQEEGEGTGGEAPVPELIARVAKSFL